MIFLNPMFGDRTSCGIRLRRGFTLPVSHEPGKVTCRRCLAKVGWRLKERSVP